MVFECAGGSAKQGLAGNRTLLQAIDAVRSGGKIIGVSWFGQPLEIDVDTLRERSLRYLFPDISTPEHLEHTVRLVASGRVRLEADDHAHPVRLGIGAAGVRDHGQQGQVQGDQSGPGADPWLNRLFAPGRPAIASSELPQSDGRPQPRGRAGRNHAVGRSFGHPVEVGRRRLAGLAVRRPGHAPVHARGGPVRGRTARRRRRSDPSVGYYSSWIQAAFLIGWALGGSVFGRLGDRIGRSRALMLTILTYALFTGLSFFAQTWWQLLIFRFLAALGIGGEWAVGAALLSETWPRIGGPGWRPFCKPRVNLGVMLAGLVVILLAGLRSRAPSFWPAFCRPCWCCGFAGPCPSRKNGTRPRAVPQGAEPRIMRSVSRPRSAATTLLTIAGLLAVADRPLGLPVLVFAASAQSARAGRAGPTPSGSQFVSQAMTLVMVGVDRRQFPGRRLSPAARLSAGRSR